MSDEGAGPSGAGLVSFKKVSKFGKVRRGIVQRKRKASDGSDDGEVESSVVSRGRGRKSNPMIQSTSGKKLVAELADSDDEEEEAERETLLSALAYESHKDEKIGSADQGATATNDIETDLSVDAQAQFQRTQEILKNRQEGKESDNVYRGLSTYGAKMRKDTATGNAANGLVRKGPIRATGNVRLSVRWDYAPDLCKDYKETGYCTFGDSCKFLHDRTDYKHGWELERDWKSGRYQKDDEDPNKYLITDEETDLPFACFICRESFTDPVVTKCGHYFCEKCALDNFRQSPKCYVCDKPTHGVYTPAKELSAKLAGEQTKKAKRAAEAAEEEADGEMSENDGEVLEEDTAMELLPDQDPNDSGSGDEKEED